MNMNNRNNHPVINPAIQARIAFFECLESDVKKASGGSELRILYEKFGNYCANLKIVHAFGNITLSDDVCNDNFRKELLSNIDMAKSVCMSKRDMTSSNPSSLTINNTNQQEQKQTQSITIDLFLEAIKDDLTGRQIREIKDVISESGSDKEKARDGIIEKLKSFGSDVAANIVANIITNPIIWGGL